MKQRNIYYRKKKEKGKRANYIIEGVKTKYGKRIKVSIKTLPDPTTLINQIDEKGSFFRSKNKQQILEIIEGLDYRPENNKNNAPKLRTTKIIGNQENDPLDDELDEIIGRAGELIDQSKDELK